MTPTINPTPAETPDSTGADYAKTIQFKAPVEKVLAALTDPAAISRWWVNTSGSGLEGGELKFSFTDDHLIARVDSANRSLVQWTPLVCTPLPDWVGTTIAFTISELPQGGSQIDFRHVGLAKLECFDMCRQGWNYYLPSLVDYVDLGQGRPGPREH